MNLDEAIVDAFNIQAAALVTHFKQHECVARVVLFSGGNDSTVLAHLFREHATHFGHCNTGIGIEQTRQYVRDRAIEWGVPLLEEHPDERDSFRTLVLDQGFPGPAQHFKMYQRLKERQLRKMRRRLVTNGRKQRVLFLAGRRKAESSRRASIPESERDGAIVWCSPLANWTTEHMIEYRERHADLPRNEVSDLLHMSGECLCGAFATENELEEIRFFFPEVVDEIEQLGKEAAACGVDVQRCMWGWGAHRPHWDSVTETYTSGPMCDSCALRRD